ncbi:short-chain fatty acyl-CoA regulator family protein [Limibaculum sp. FT325]|uniref:short-chain fatty acyl-CoA regulator family protein n=1 Tax=Thermohalobaculum sediminis TaxID=2939436 RepID=UPI0020BE00DE|nr:XRE family transcriptional regulator [Limibaculum sediminis]MCL5776316.1 short-chain fatty acyl-CoA regulator family protein [Limibaculum sediminis]
MARSIIGARIRERRRSIGVTQSELAHRIGISPSYLNLIESNKRGVGEKLVGRLARELGVRVEDLDGAAERRLLDQLRDVAADPRLSGLGVEDEQAGEVVGRFPGWARAIATLARSERELAAMVRAMSDRLKHDPFLGEAVHRMLTHTAALRSASEILTDVPDLEPAQRERFEAILATESRRLSDVGGALAAYFDRSNTTRVAATPADEIDAVFEANANRFAAIEAAVAGDSPSPAPGATTEDDLVTEAEARAGGAIEAVLDAAADLAGEPARARLRARLVRYAADAIALPDAAFASAARSAGYDLDVIAARLGQPHDRVCRRLTSLAPAPGRPRFGYLATNAAGVVTECFTIPGLAPPRHGEACPLWVNCRAAVTPGRTLRQRALFPTGLGFVFVARARQVGAPGFGSPTVHVTDLLAMDEHDATLTVYAPGRHGDTPAEPVGTSCRICPRDGCLHRVGEMRAGG